MFFSCEINGFNGYSTKDKATNRQVGKDKGVASQSKTWKKNDKVILERVVESNEIG